MSLQGGICLKGTQVVRLELKVANVSFPQNLHQVSCDML